MAGIRLSRRESEVARLVAEGLTNKQIAERLFIGERTAEWHVEQICNKLGFNTRSQIAAWVASGPAGTPLPRSEIPRPISSLVGRQDEIRSTSALVKEAPLVTICGPGGIGKTRLAVEVARELEGQLTGGAWLVELAGVADGESVAGAVSHALRLTQATADSAIEQIVRFVSNRQGLILLDNCEHLIEASAEVAERVLEKAARMRILATSREPLGVPGEHVVRIEALMVDRELGWQSEAMQLLAERCRQVGGGEPGPDDLAPAITICQRLDGLPLAIELAAAQTAALSLADVAARLDDRFSLLASGARTAAPRQQTLQATADWSYQLLPAPERLAFRRLAVFAGGFDLDAAAGVLELDAPAAIQTIGSLVRKSMVIVRGQQPARRRYHMLDTLREFGRARLAEEGETELARGRHAAYYRDLAIAAFPQLRSRESHLYIAQLDQERDNLNAALQFFAITSSRDFVVAVAALGRYWIHGRLRDGYEWTARAVETDAASGQTLLDLLEAWSWLTFQRNDIETAMAAANRLLEEATRQNSPKHAGRAMNLVAMFQGDRGSPVDDDYWARAETLLRQSGSKWDLALLLNDRGFFQALMQGDLRRGLNVIVEAEQIARQVGDSWLIGFVLDSAAWAHAELGELDAAAAKWSEGISRLRGGPDAWGLPFQLEGLSRVARLQGRLQTACTLLGAAAAIREEIGSQPLESWTRFTQVDVEALRESMSRDDFGAAWQSGFAMASDEAADYALEQRG